MSASPVLGTYCHEKEYKVLVARHPDERQLTAWRTGVVLEDGYRTKPAKVRVSGTYGKRHLAASNLDRRQETTNPRNGPSDWITGGTHHPCADPLPELGKLRPGQWRPLTPQEIAELKRESSISQNQIIKKSKKTQRKQY